MFLMVLQKSPGFGLTAFAIASGLMHYYFLSHPRRDRGRTIPDEAGGLYRGGS